MSIPSRIPTQHSQTGFYQGVIERTPSPFFAPPVPSGMIEPGSNFITIITAAGPHTTELPGIAAGFRPKPGSNMPVSSVPPLTRKGG
jgi:hypothetical protein